MPEIQTKDKLITLEELGVALDSKAGVTGVKGDAESSYRTGNVNLTPANVGAVAKSGDTMTGSLTMTAGSPINAIPSGERLYIWLNPQGDYASDIKFRCNNIDKWALSSRNSSDDYYFGLYNYTTTEWSAKFSKNDIVHFAKPLPADSGGTGATTAAGARANLGVNDIGTSQAQSAINLTTDGQVYSITITKDCWVCASFHIIASTDGTAMLWRNNIPVIKNEHTNGACNYWANAQFPCKAGGLLQYQLNTNASDSNIYFLTV